MAMKLTLTIAAASALLFGSLVQATETAAPVPAERDPASIAAALAKAATGNVDEGKRLHNYLYCSACHGETGASPSRNWPSLTGQKADYTMKTLLDYKDNLRRDNYRKADVMHRMAQLLTEEQMADLSAYYASQPLPGKPAGINAKLAKKGEAGVTPDTPALAGQTPEYFIQAMTMYQQDMRNSDVGGMMRMVAKPLTADEIKALAHYYASLGQ